MSLNSKSNKQTESGGNLRFHGSESNRCTPLRAKGPRHCRRHQQTTPALFRRCLNDVMHLSDDPLITEGSALLNRRKITVKTVSKTAIFDYSLSSDFSRVRNYRVKHFISEKHREMSDIKTIYTAVRRPRREQSPLGLPSPL